MATPFAAKHGHGIDPGFLGAECMPRADAFMHGDHTAGLQASQKVLWRASAACLHNLYTLLQNDVGVQVVVDRAQCWEQAQVDTKGSIRQRLDFVNRGAELILALVHGRGHHPQSSRVGDGSHESWPRNVHHTAPNDRMSDAKQLSQAGLDHRFLF